MRPAARGGITLLRDAGVDIGIMGVDEACCGGRAYELGYAGELIKYAEHQMETFRTAGVKTLVTPCSDCYACFKVLYDKIGRKLGIEVLHITQYLDLLIREGKIKLTKEVPLTVTYHDPCHLGRLGEPWVHWQGKEKKVMGQLIVHDPPKKYRRGANGVYEMPRDILRSIPGLQLVELDHNREDCTCCGGGGNLEMVDPKLATAIAQSKIEEIQRTGAELVVTSCQQCVRTMVTYARRNKVPLEVIDITTLVQRALADEKR